MAERENEDQRHRDIETPPRLPLGKMVNHASIERHLRKRADEVREAEQEKP